MRVIADRDKSLMILAASCRPFHGLAIRFNSDPGACAPGFMLAPASQATTALLVQSAANLHSVIANRSTPYLPCLREFQLTSAKYRALLAYLCSEWRRPNRNVTNHFGLLAHESITLAIRERKMLSVCRIDQQFQFMRLRSDPAGIEAQRVLPAKLGRDLRADRC